MYEEYVESNYIDFLYEKCMEKKLSNKNFFIRGISKNYKTILVIFCEFLLVVSLFLLKDATMSKNTPLYLTIILIIVYLGNSFLKEKLNSKVDKLIFIKKFLNLYDFVLVDDLDRIYANHTEVLKMLHFLQENLNNTKLILLSDKSKFEENGIDILEKYYDISFEIPKFEISRCIIGKFSREIQPILYNDEIDEVLAMMRNLNIRTIKRIINHYNEDLIYNSTNVKKFFRSDYIFMLMIYYKYNDVEFIINKISDLKSPVINGNHMRSMDSIIENINRNLKFEQLTDRENNFSLKVRPIIMALN